MFVPVLLVDQLNDPKRVKEKTGDCDRYTKTPTIPAWRITFAQILTGVIVNVANLSPGMAMGFSAIALPQLQSGIHEDSISVDQASWIAGMMAAATPIGCLINGPILDKLGRRSSLLLLNLPGLVGWALIAFTPSSNHQWFLPIILIGRLLTGVSVGMASIPAAVYLGESSQQRLRGALVTFPSISFSLGIVLVYVLGWWYQERWREVAALCGAFPLASLALISCLIVESPIWLLARGEISRAEDSLRWLRGVSKNDPLPESIQEEFDKMSEPYISKGTEAENVSKTTFKDVWAQFKKPEAYKPLAIMNIFFLLQQMCGIYIIIYYAVDVAKEAGVNIDSYLAAILIGLTKVAATSLVSVCSKSLGRRIPSILSGIGMCVFMAILASYLFLRDQKMLDEETLALISWLPVATIILFIFTGTFGFMSLPWAMLGEVFPEKIRGVAGGITTSSAYFYSFLATKIYPLLLLGFGRSGAFFCFSGVSFFGTLFVYFFLPETQGKTLTEIEEHFAGRSQTKTHKKTTKELESLLQKV